MTYGELLEKLYELSPSQLNCDITVEIAVDYGQNECYPAELKICGIEHGVLDEDHPVIFVGN